MNNRFHAFSCALLLAALSLAAACTQSATGQEIKPVAPAPPKPKVPGVVIDASPDPQRVYIGSPSLAVLPGGTYVASHDFFGPGTTNSRTAVFESANRGKSWKKLAELEGQWWSSLFVHRGALYILGNSREYGNVVIRRSTDGGKSWTTPKDATSGLLFPGKWHCAPVPVVVHDGRLWRAMEQIGTGGWPRQFQACVLSAPEGSDLLQAANWTATNPVAFNKDWMNAPAPGWLEGNVVVTPEGKLVEIMRLATYGGPGNSKEFTGPAAGLPRFETAAMLEVAPGGKTLAFDPAKGFFRFPGAESKFTIRFDPKSGKYWALVQKITNFEGGATAAQSPSVQRNVLALTSSKNLRDWKVETIVLRYGEGRALTSKDKVGFQYVDWLFDGEDIIAACRTAWGKAHNYHDANYLTFHRIKNFRRLTMKDAAPDLAGSAKQAGKTAGKTGGKTNGAPKPNGTAQAAVK